MPALANRDALSRDSSRDLVRDHRRSAIGRNQSDVVRLLRPQRHAFVKLHAFGVFSLRNQNCVAGMRLAQRGVDAGRGATKCAGRACG